MYWTNELASYLEDAPFPATKTELIDYCKRSGALPEVISNLKELDQEGPYENIKEIWEDYSEDKDFLVDEESLSEY